MILASEIRKGTKLLYKSAPHVVIDFHSVKPGKGGAYIKTKMKNMITGLVIEDSFRSSEKLAAPDLEYKEMQYLYQEDNSYHFLDQESFEQVSLSESQIEEVKKYLKEETVYNTLYFSEKPIAVTPPLFMNLKVTETQPGVRGDTAKGGATKPATLETGLKILVPLFVDEGQTIKVDTRDGVYIERVTE